MEKTVIATRQEIIDNIKDIKYTKSVNTSVFSKDRGKTTIFGEFRGFRLFIIREVSSTCEFLGQQYNHEYMSLDEIKTNSILCKETTVKDAKNWIYQTLVKEKNYELLPMYIYKMNDVSKDTTDKLYKYLNERDSVLRVNVDNYKDKEGDKKISIQISLNSNNWTSIEIPLGLISDLRDLLNKAIDCYYTNKLDEINFEVKGIDKIYNENNKSQCPVCREINLIKEHQGLYKIAVLCKHCGSTWIENTYKNCIVDLKRPWENPICL